MTKIVLKKGESLEEQKKKLHALQERSKGLDAKKYSGIIKLKEDPLEYQKKIRKEWDEPSS